jgi:diacylglycerol kinase family enzyme
LNELPSVPLSVLPTGTENLVARHFGLTSDPEGLATLLAGGRSVRVDVGLAAGRRFLLMAGFGFDADVVTRHHQARLSRSGVIRPTHRMAYIEPILRSSLAYRFPTISVRIAHGGTEEVLIGTTVFVFNLPRYALGLPFAPAALHDDGWLDLIVFRDPGPFQALYYLWTVCCGSHLDQPGVFHRRVKKLVVTADHPIPVQLDGDPGGYVLPQGGTAPKPARDCDCDCASDHRGPTHEWTIEVLPAALDVIAGADRFAPQTGVPLARDGVAR